MKSQILSITGTGSKTAYNPTIPFNHNGRECIGLRVESFSSELDSRVMFACKQEGSWVVDALPCFQLQDPAVMQINGNLLLVGVNVEKAGKKLMWKTDFYHGASVDVEKRADQGNHWTNLRNCAFLEDFKKEKIIWIELTDKNKFSYSDKEEYILAGAFLMTGESLKYLLSFLNSRLCKFYFKLICNSSGMGTVQWKKFAMEKIPIPRLSKTDQKPFIRLVDQILPITKSKDYLDNPDKQTKVKRLEKEIDQLVYKLYGLTKDEIKIVEEFNDEQ